MKTLIFFLVIMMCISCTKEPNEPTDLNNQKNANVTLDYAFPSRTGDITAKGESVYLDFYTKYIESKILTPRTYILSFHGLTNDFVLSVTGKWSDKDLISLPPDKYSIIGSSVPKTYELCGDTCYLQFGDTIDVTATTTNITLRAFYTCALLLFDATNIESTNINAEHPEKGYTYKTTMVKTEEFYHTFLLTSGGGTEDYGMQGAELSLTIYTKDNGEWGFGIWKYQFMPGKYYSFSSSDGGFTLPQMIDASDNLLPMVNQH
jgi:hypothetical protein